MTTPVSPEEWAARIPWHTKAQAVAALERRAGDLEARVAELRQEASALEFAAIQVRKVAHAAYIRGERTDWVVAGERAYQRNRNRPLTDCPECHKPMRRAYLPTHLREQHPPRETRAAS